MADQGLKLLQICAPLDVHRRKEVVQAVLAILGDLCLVVALADDLDKLRFDAGNFEAPALPVLP
jgi:hypothetical protein